MKKRPNDAPHRRAFKKAHGRPPKPGFHVHHLDGDWSNNSVENLVELSPEQHFDAHYKQGDWAACLLLARVSKIDAAMLAKIQRQHGLNCARNKCGIHADSYDHTPVLKKMWDENPPGRKPVTDGKTILKFKTELEIDQFLEHNKTWRKGLPDNAKSGLKLSTRRIDSAEAKEIAATRLKNGTHNFIQESTCPYCNKKGKGPMMKRWHFDNCKTKHNAKYKGEK